MDESPKNMQYAYMMVNLARVQHNAWRSLPQNKGHPLDKDFFDLPWEEQQKNLHGVRAVIREYEKMKAEFEFGGEPAPREEAPVVKTVQPPRTMPIREEKKSSVSNTLRDLAEKVDMEIPDGESEEDVRI